MEEKRCLLCNKPYNYKYEMFGRGCLDNLYELLGFSKSHRIIFNKELNLCTRIVWRNHKFFLNKSKKYALAQKYIALTYLNMMKYESLNDVKEKISNDIKNIKTFSKGIIETISISLNEVYKLFNYSQKFNKLLEEAKKINWEEVDKKVAENFIKSMSFIFDVSKKNSPIAYSIFYAMQYTFWQVVVVGGLLTDMKLSARLLSNSLSLFGKQPKDLDINDEETIKSILESKSFKEGINQLINKYGKEKEEFLVDKNAPSDDVIIRFDKEDLNFALHDATMFVVANKNEENKWNFEIEINDTYDFTDFKDLEEYADVEDVKTDILSTLLNNLGVISSEYGVLKTYNVKIKFKTKEGEF